MEKRRKEQVRELDPGEHRHVWIASYWRNGEGDGPHIGYGIAKGYVWMTLVGTVVSLTMQLYNRFVAPKLRTRPLGGAVIVPWLAWMIFIAIRTIRSWQNGPVSGFYELDETGTPIRYLSRSDPPSSILGRTGSGRRAFLRECGVSEGRGS